MSIKSFKNAAWSLMIAKGGVVKMGDHYGRNIDEPDDNFFGDGWKYLYEDTVLALSDMQTSGIAITDMAEPRDRSSYHFNGTFTDSQNHCKHLYGELICGNGNMYHWGLDTEEYSLHELIKLFDKFGTFGLSMAIVGPPNFKQSLLDLEDRLTQKWAADYWSAYCRLSHP
jgi:hypothetical protein